MLRLIIAALVALAGAAGAQDYGRTHRLKLTVGGASRKAGMFLPKTLRKNELVPVLVAVPGEHGKAFLEIGQWQQQSFERRFAVFSVDITTSSRKGWAVSDQLDMQRDMEAVTEGLKLAIETARTEGVEIDETATVLTGHSGGTYLTLWLGLRRPDLFMAVCGRSCVFHKDTVKFGKLDTVPPNYDMPIYLYRGELDHPRVSKDTEQAKKTLSEAGYRNVTYEVIPRMVHESKPEVFLDWYYKLLKKTEKGRREARKIAEELVKLKASLEMGKGGIYAKLQKLVDREEKAGFAAGAKDLMDAEKEKARKEFRRAEDLEANGALREAIDVFRQIERTFMPLPIAKSARTRAGKVARSDAFKAMELLEKAKAYREKGLDVKASEILEKIVDQYPETPAADEAEHLLQS